MISLRVRATFDRLEFCRGHNAATATWVAYQLDQACIPFRSIDLQHPQKVTVVMDWDSDHDTQDEAEDELANALDKTDLEVSLWRVWVTQMDMEAV